MRARQIGFAESAEDSRISVRAESIPTFANLVRDGHPNYPLSKTYDAVKDEVAEHAENEIRKDFTPLERVAIGKAVEAELGKRQGQRTDLANENQGGLLELRPNLDEVEPGKRTDQIAAEKAGFGSKSTYRDAKTVTEKAVPELVSAVDRGDVAISTAAKLASAP